ncbi:MAG: DUF4956 domain-containing protein, partial [Pirellulaceae bacterium]
MDELIKQLNAQGGQGDYLSNIEVVIALLLSVLCSAAIAQVYRWTHRGTGYSQSYVQSLLLLGLVTTLIMVVVGSNIARAFSLVGALSIVRFRNAIKETRDVAFIFFVMAIAMACGTRFYTVAVIATVLNCGVIVWMYISNFGAARIIPERLLCVQLPHGEHPEANLEATLGKLFETFSLVSMQSVKQGLYLEAVYSVRPHKNVAASQVIDEISRVNQNLKVTYNQA